jgi:hypothetical protein
MSRGPCTFKQRDVIRAIKAAQKAGLRVVAIKPDGTVVTSATPVQDCTEPAATEPRPQVIL